MHAVKLLPWSTSAGALTHTSTVCVGVGVGVGDAVDVAVADGVGVGPITCTESPYHVAGIWIDVLSYSTCSPTKLMLLVLQYTPTTLNSMHDRFPTPLAPRVPGTLLMIRTTPCTPGGSRLHPTTGIAVPPIDPSLTSITCITSGSYVTS